MTRWCAYWFHNTFLEFLERAYIWTDKWFNIYMHHCYSVLDYDFVLRGLVAVRIQARICIRLHPTNRIISVTWSLWFGENSGSFFCMVLGTILVSFTAKSDRTLLPYYRDRYQKLAFRIRTPMLWPYKSSFFMITLVSGFHSRGVICTSGTFFRGVYGHNLMPWSTCVLCRNSAYLILLFGKAFSKT